MLTSDWLAPPPNLAFKVQMSKFYHKRTGPKAAKMKTILTLNYMKVIKDRE